MPTSKLSEMDEKPSNESFHRNLAFFATAVVAVHVSSRYDSHGESFAGWLGSTMPMVLTGFILIGFLCYATSDTGFFTLTTIHAESGREEKVLRTPSDPAREDRHLFYTQVVAFAWSLGSSIDLVWGWYLVCHAIWDGHAKDEASALLLFVTLVTAVVGVLLLMTWIPTLNLLDAGRSFDDESSSKGSENGDAGSRAKMRTLIAAAEAYEKEVLSKKERSQSKVEDTGELLAVLREWQASDQ